MIFASTRPGGLGSNDFYISTRTNLQDDLAWQPPVRLDAISSSSDEFGPWGFEDQNGLLTLYFNSNRPGGLGGNDIYVSRQGPDGSFGTPILVPELNSTSNETFPTIRPDGLELFLVSDRPGGVGGLDIWVATRASTTSSARRFQSCYLGCRRHSVERYSWRRCHRF